MSRPCPFELREAAKRYRELGWQVVPVNAKSRVVNGRSND